MASLLLAVIWLLNAPSRAPLQVNASLFGGALGQLVALHRVAQLVVAQAERGGGCALVETMAAKRFLQQRFFIMR